MPSRCPRSVVVLLTLVALVAAAAAQPSLTPPSAPSEPLKSPRNALIWSLGGTLASGLAITLGAIDRDEENYGKVSSRGRVLIGFGSVGLMTAPAFGHWYSRNYWTLGMGLRLGGTLWSLIMISSMGSNHCPDDGPGNECRILEVGLYAGAATIATGIVYDVATAPREAGRVNARAGRASPPPIAPAVVTSADGRHGPGVAVSGTF